MITFENVSKKFGDGTYGISDITLEIPDGDFIFLVGQSGAGKTTLLKLMIGQMRATSGVIKVDDLEVTKLKPHNIHRLRRKIGVVFQDFKLLQDQTVYENVALALEVVGQKEKKYKAQILDMLSKVGLSGKERYFPAQLSGGELQRTAIARALATEAKILVADEPTGDLDPKTAWEILRLLNDINASGTTVIMATHNHTIVDEMRKRVITIDHGRVASDVRQGGYETKQQLPEPPAEHEITPDYDTPHEQVEEHTV